MNVLAGDNVGFSHEVTAGCLVVAVVVFDEHKEFSMGVNEGVTAT